jgi:hypothetical protein
MPASRASSALGSVASIALSGPNMVNVLPEPASGNELRRVLELLQGGGVIVEGPIHFSPQIASKLPLLFLGEEAASQIRHHAGSQLQKYLTRLTLGRCGGDANPSGRTR